jgi:hypothetical protein
MTFMEISRRTMTDNISAFSQRKPAGCRATRVLKLKKTAHLRMSGLKKST